MPNLNFTTPLHKFNNGLSYTAIKDCYVTGTMYHGQVLEVNNTVIFSLSLATGNVYSFNVLSYMKNCLIPPFKISVGDVITINASNGAMGVYEEL